ncbi:uncharacterized protein JCM6883_006643 [Sporobolomyces salmoneus]|uniref:uncharacterized protein n=1 Tax=Sporobolomyces salmoneus TaxID=183962 RepID=UPI00317D84BF
MDQSFLHQFEQSSLVGAQESFLSATSRTSLSPLSPSPYPKPPPSLLSLPPELVLKILRAYPASPSTPWRAALLNLCLVNRRISEIARTVLYRHLYLPLTFDYNAVRSSHAKLVRTLVEEDRRAEAVRSLRITIGNPRRSELLQFAYVLSNLTNLQRLFTSWEDHRLISGGIIDEFCGIVARNCRQLVTLELPYVVLSTSSVTRICTSLSELESLTLRGRGISPQLVPKFKLRSLTFLSLGRQGALETLSSSSHESLTTISLYLYREPHLSMFPNLKTVRLDVQDAPESGDEDDFATDQNGLGNRDEWTDIISWRITMLLGSIQSCPKLENLSISFNCSDLALDVSTHPILDRLPPTLRTFSISSSILGGGGGVDRKLLIPRYDFPPCPELKLLRILPPGHTSNLDRITHEFMELTRELVREDCEELGIEVNLATNQGERFGVREALDPDGEEEW